MAKKFLSPLNLLNLTSDPGTAAEGDFYWNSSTNRLRIYFDGAWADVSSNTAFTNAANTFTTAQTITPATSLTGLTINAASSAKGLIVKANATTPGNLQEWQNSSGTALSYISASGNAFLPGIRNVADDGAYINMQASTSGILINTRAAANKGLVIQATASQSANLQEWQNSAGTVLSKINQVGSGVFGNGTLNAIGNLNAFSSGTTVVPLVVQGIASQSADLIQAQNSAGSVVFKVSPTGVINAGGATTIGNILNFSDPGIAVETRFNFLRATDSAWLAVNEYASDQTYYEFGMSDNPGSGDYYQWRFDEWTAPGHGWMPLQIGAYTTRFIAPSITQYGNIALNPYNTSFATVNNVVTSAANYTVSRYSPTNSTTYSLKKDTGTGTGTVTLNTQTYTGTNIRNYWIEIETGGTTFKWGTDSAAFGGTIGTAVAITGAAQTLDNGLQVTLSTTGHVAGDRWSWQSSPRRTIAIGGSPITGAMKIIYPSSALIGTVIRGASGQTANLQEWQNSAGSILSGIHPNGYIFAGSAHSGGWLSVTPSISTERGIVVRGATSQTADLQQWQNSAGTILASVASDGTLSTNRYLINQAVNTPYLDFVSNRLYVQTRNAGYVGLTIQGATSQTGDLQQWQDSAGTTLGFIDADGKAYFSHSSTNTGTFGVEGTLRLRNRSATNNNYSLIEAESSGGGISSGIQFITSDHTNSYGRMIFGTRSAAGFNSAAFTVESGGGITTTLNTTTTVGLIVKAAASQTADLQQWQNSAGTATAYINSGGNFAVSKSNARITAIHDASNTAQLGADAGSTYVGSTTSTPLYLVTNNTERMRITSSGDIGIGTTSPSSILQIGGDSTYRELTIMRNTDGVSGNVLVFKKSRGTQASPTILSSGDQLGYIYFQGHDGSAYQNAAMIRAEIDTTPGAGDMPGKLSFQTATDGTATLTERMSINSAGLVSIPGSLTVTGDLIINGTTTNINTTNLVVEDKNIILGDVTTPSNTTADGGGITLKGATDKTFNWVNSTGYWTSNVGVEATSFVRTSGTSSQFLKADGSVDSSTYLTTGTASSTYAPLNSPALIGATTFGDGTTVEGRITSSGDTFYVQAGNNNADTTAKLNIARNGTTSATISQFNVYADASTFSSSLTAGRFIPTSSTVPTNGMYLSAANTLNFATNTANRMVIDSSGNVGIGTAPSAGYSIQSSKNLTGSTTAIGFHNSGTIQSDVTTAANIYYTTPATAATSFTLANLRHYMAVQGTFGAGSSVTNQYGFAAYSNLTGATNNYAFYSEIPSASNRWNFYAVGTAANYFAGQTTIGSTSLTLGNNGTANSSTHQFGVVSSAAGNVVAVVRGAASQTANLQEWQNSAGTNVARILSDGQAAFGTIYVPVVSNTSTGSNSAITMSATGTQITTAVATNIALTIQNTNASPTGNLTEWKNTGGTVVATMSPIGAFTAITKSFDIPHPTKENMRLRYGSLEGPENGVYVRGNTKNKVIELPDYWTGLVDESTITVTLTSIGKFQKVYVEKIEDNKVYVGGRVKEISYVVFGERKDTDKLTVEY